MTFNRTHLILLTVLSKSGAMSAGTAITSKDMENFCPIGKSHATMHRAIQFLVKSSYIYLGVKDGKFNTYYINENGISKLKEML